MTTARHGFQSIRDEVLARIQNRIWPPGTLLPPETDLAREFGCARATVNRALRELAERGVIDRKRKSGTRVAVAPARQAKFEIAVVRHMIEDLNARYRYALVHRSLAPAPNWLSAQLQIAPDQHVLHLRCMHFADNQPFQFEERWINTSTVPTVVEADFSSVGPNEWLLAEVPFTDAEIVFSAIAADETLAQFLATPVATPLMQMERTTWLQGQPVTFVRMTYHAGYRMQTKY